VDPVPPAQVGRIVPYLLVDGAADAIDFYRRAFGAEERYRLTMPGGGIGHAELSVFGAALHLADAPDDLPGGARHPGALGGTSVLLHQYVEDVDAVAAAAESAGAPGVGPPKGEFYGDRTASVLDPFGHQWSFHTHLRDVTAEEMQAAVEAMG
jgi:PhnB protein